MFLPTNFFLNRKGSSVELQGFAWIGVVLALLGVVFGGLVFVAGALVENAEAAPIPPELEAAYRQVGARTGVHWAALAAWDGAAFGFSLPLPSVDSIFAERIEERLEAKRREAEEWCRSHPQDTVRCPPEPPELTNQEVAAAWRSAHTTWRQMLVAHVEAHALGLGGVEHDPEAVYARLLGPSVGARAAELFEGYQLLDSLAADADEIVFLPPSEPPADWVPVDGFAWPVLAPITSRYGRRVSPIDGVERLHSGIDLGVATGAPVRAAKAGTVAVASWSDVYGLMVVIDHGDGYASLYAHNSALAVQPGQQVEQGQVVSLAGSTGWSTGPHLHFEIHYNGTPIDPLLILTQRSGRD